MRLPKWFLTLPALLLLWVGQAAACPNCKEAVAAEDENAVKDGSEPPS